MANTIKSEKLKTLIGDILYSETSEDAAKSINALIDHIDKDRAERDRRIVAATVEACKNECERTMMFEGGRQMSYAHNGVFAAAKAIRAITPESVLADIDKKQEIAA